MHLASIAGMPRQGKFDQPWWVAGWSLGGSPDGPVLTIDLGGEDVRTIRRTTTQPVRSIKAHRPRKAAHVS
jgi:hypothetical protein